MALSLALFINSPVKFSQILYFFLPSFFYGKPIDTMGLAEPKRKKKLLPSNYGPSSWSNAAPGSSIGFKLMSSMGWAPGSGLGNDLQGEKDNIKYVLKDDVLGLGAKKEYGGGVWKGTGEVDDLYRRLDVGGGQKPHDEEVKIEVKEQIKILPGWKMKFHVGDTYTSSFSREESEVEAQASMSSSSGESGSAERSKKRKRDDKKEKKKKRVEKDGPKESDDDKNAALKGDKKEKTLSGEAAGETSSTDDSNTSEVKRKKKKNGVVEESKHVDGIFSTDTKIAAEKKTKEKRKSKKERRRKDESSSKEKRKSKLDKSSRTGVDDNKAIDLDPTSSKSLSAPSPDILTPARSLSPEYRLSPIPRHMHRARFLAMKRASVMDQNALREILGVTG